MIETELTTSTTATSSGTWSLPPAIEPKPLTREAILPYWTDPKLSVERIAMLFGTTPPTLRRKRVEWDLPPREYVQFPKSHAVTREMIEPLWNDPGVSMRQVAVRLGISDSAVLRLARDFDLGKKPPNVRATGPTPFDMETLRQHWMSKERTVVGIAEVFGCSEKTVRFWASKWKFGPRPGTIPEDPTPEEIYARAAEIRKTWPESRFR